MPCVGSSSPRFFAAVAGCDSGGADTVPFANGWVVDAVPDGALGPVLSFGTEGEPGCAQPTAYATRVSRDLLAVEVRHRGETDRCTVQPGDEGPALQAVREIGARTAERAGRGPQPH